MQQNRNTTARTPLPVAGNAEDFTTPFLVVAGALCFLALCTIWAVAGLPFTVVLAFLTDRLFLRR